MVGEGEVAGLALGRLPAVLVDVLAVALALDLEALVLLLAGAQLALQLAFSSKVPRNCVKWRWCACARGVSREKVLKVE